MSYKEYKPDYIIYTDGGCTPNPGGIGGYGAVIIHRESGKKWEINGSYYPTTNNRMEVMALIEALKSLAPPISSDTSSFSSLCLQTDASGQMTFAPKESLPAQDKTNVLVYTDSAYLIHTAAGHWKREKNQDIWEEYSSLSRHFSIRFLWIQGHQGDELNERCDILATQAIQTIQPREDTGYKTSTEYQMLEQKNRANKAASVTLNAMYKTITIPESLKKEEESRNISQAFLEKNGLNTEGIKSILKFMAIPIHSFRHYKDLHTGGKDTWSDYRGEKLKEKIGRKRYESIQNNLAEYPARIESAARWYGRGLSLQDAIRKELVNEEIYQNAQNARKKEKTQSR